MTRERDYAAATLLQDDEPRLIHYMITTFSTREPFPETLRKQLHLIGLFLKEWCGADRVIQFFSNPNLCQIHWIPIEGGLSEFRQESLRIVIEDERIRPVRGDEEVNALLDRINFAGSKCLLVPFCQNGHPFGYFILAFSGTLPSGHLIVKTASSLNVLQGVMRSLLYNHYPITSGTYLPSFQSQRRSDVLVLFCDIRNSTAVHEIARMAREEAYTEVLVTFIKSFLEYASRIISVPAIGRIYHFTGDGFLAMFGEHLVADAAQKAQVACALGLLVARLLVEAFDALWLSVTEHALFQNYLARYNEDIDLTLGVGLNYGEVVFDTFGIAVDGSERGAAPLGFHEYTAIGDIVNYTARLCSVASQPASTAPVAYRSESMGGHRLIAPIVTSRTVAYWCREGLTALDPLATYRTEFVHKGKGHPMPAFELSSGAMKTTTLLAKLGGIEGNRLSDFLKPEVDAKVETRPVLKAVRDRLQDKLNAIRLGPA